MLSIIAHVAISKVIAAHQVWASSLSCKEPHDIAVIQVTTLLSANKPDIETRDMRLRCFCQPTVCKIMLMQANYSFVSSIALT